MQIVDVMKERRSIRAFKEREIKKKQVKKLLNAARWAPSAMNSQPWEFIIIRDERLREKIAHIKGQQFIAEAPVIIAFVTDPETSHFHKIDGSLATQNFQLAAWAQGLGTCWIGTFDREKVKQLLEIPDHKHLLTVMPLGYPAEEGESSRKPLEDITYKEKYARKWE